MADVRLLFWTPAKMNSKKEIKTKLYKTKYVTFSIDPMPQKRLDENITIHDCTSEKYCLYNPLTKT